MRILKVPDQTNSNTVLVVFFVTRMSPVHLSLPAERRLNLAISHAVAQALQSHWREQSTALETREESVTVRGLGIQIHTTRGIATLSGTVQDPAQVQQAEMLARDVVGVRQVTNRLIAASLFEWD